MSKDIGVLGSEEFVLGFRLAGIKKAWSATEETYARELERILKDAGTGILVVDSADLSKIAAGLRRRALDSIDPVVIQMGDTGSGDLREKVKSAIGIDLYK